MDNKLERCPFGEIDKMFKKWEIHRNKLPSSADEILDELKVNFCENYLNTIFTERCYWKKKAEEILNKGKIEKPTSTYFITIAPKDDITIEEFIDSINILYTYKWITKAVGSIEQRGTTENDMGKGKHFHCLAEVSLGIAKKTIIKKIESMYKGLNLDIPAEKIDVSNPCKSNRDITNRIEYMTDAKADDIEKKDKYCMDEPYRKKENIPRWFLKNSNECWEGEPLTSP